MGYADRDDYLHDYDPDREGTGIFPVLGHAPGPGAGQYAGYERYAPGPPGHYARPGGYAAGPPPADTTKQTRAIRQLADPARPERPAPERRPRRPSRRRPDRWVIAVASIAGAVAVYVAFTTAAVPAKPMPSPFAPATTQRSSGGANGVSTAPPGRGAPARPASKVPVTCVTPGP
jgi:hypothetical protein